MLAPKERGTGSTSIQRKNNEKLNMRLCTREEKGENGKNNQTTKYKATSNQNSVVAQLVNLENTKTKTSN